MPDLLNELILSIYQGVLEKKPWTNFLVKLQAYFKGDSAVVLMVASGEKPGEKYLLNRVLINQHEVRPMSYKWLALDPFENIPKNTIVLLDELDHESPMECNDFYKNLIESSGNRYVMAVNILSENTTDLVLKLRLARNVENKNFTALEKQTFSTLVPHLKLAADYFNLIAVRQVERNAYADAVNQFRLGALVVDENGKIIASNTEAQQSIERYNFLQIQDGKLKISTKQIHQQFCEALNAISKTPDLQQQAKTPINPVTIVIALDSGQNFSLMIRKIREDDGINHPVHSHAVIFLRDPNSVQKIAPETLQKLFGFTKKQAKVAAYLANGYSLSEAADVLSVSINTIKTHAHNIYEKTGVNKQAKFIQLVANSVAGVS